MENRKPWNKGKKMTLKYRENISKSLVGKFGSESRGWKGDKAGYVAIHTWLIKNFKKPKKCQKCWKSKVSRLEWANISGKYTRDIKDYLALCPPCHRRMDIGNYCRKGHKYTEENTYIRKEGWRVCKICHKERWRRYVEKNYKIQRQKS